jgi:spermidine synthase
VGDDARSFLAGSGRRFDVIVGDLFVPWRPGEAALYTAEAFTAARDALAPGGLYCQWAPLYQLDPAGFRILLATFTDVFPRTTLWRGDFEPTGPALALCGEGEGFHLDPDASDAALRDLGPRLASSAPVLSAPAGLWLHLVARLGDADLHLDGVRRNRDGTPWLELCTPGARAHASTDGGGGGEPPGAWLDRFTAELGSEPERALRDFLGPQRSGYRDAGLIFGRATVEATLGHPTEADALAHRAFDALPAETAEALESRLAPRP